MGLFNSVQLKCYVLLKQVKKEILQRLMNQESLSSYHCKTCMFYIIEITPSSFWVPENVFQCLVASIKLLIIWTTNGFCPNYFIPSENMFDRLSTDIQKKLNLALHNIVSSECRCLLQIRSEDIGRRLEVLLMNSGSNRAPQASLQNKQGSEYLLHTLLLSSIHGWSAITIEKCITRGQCITENVESLLQLMRKYKGTRSLTIHTEEETRRVISYLLHRLELTFMTNLIALTKQQGSRREEIWQYLSSDIWHHLSQKSGITVKLKQATLLYMFGYYHASLVVLSSVASNLNDKWTLCTCYDPDEKCVRSPPLHGFLAATGGELNTTTLIKTHVP